METTTNAPIVSSLPVIAESNQLSSCKDDLPDSVPNTSSLSLISSTIISTKPSFLSDMHRRDSLEGKESMPKRPRSRYNLFYQVERQLVMGSLIPTNASRPELQKTRLEDAMPHPKMPDRYRNAGIVNPVIVIKTGRRKHCKVHGKIGFVELSQQIAKVWKESDQETKDYFKALAEQDVMRYRKEMEAYNKKHQRDGVTQTEKKVTAEADRMGSNLHDQKCGWKEAVQSKKHQRDGVTQTEKKVTTEADRMGSALQDQKCRWKDAFPSIDEISKEEINEEKENGHIASPPNTNNNKKRKATEPPRCNGSNKSTGEGVVDNNIPDNITSIDPSSTPHTKSHGTENNMLSMQHVQPFAEEGSLLGFQSCPQLLPSDLGLLGTPLPTITTPLITPSHLPLSYGFDWEQYKNLYRLYYRSLIQQNNKN